MMDLLQNITIVVLVLIVNRLFKIIKEQNEMIAIITKWQLKFRP